MSFINKTVIITGASSGIGAATAKAFLSSGAKVILVARNKEKMQASFDSYDQNQYAIYPFDLSQIDEIDSFVSKIIEKEGPIDILFNNAGIGSDSLFEETDLSVFHELMQLDYFSVIYFTQSILRHMLENGGGHIATNTSVAGLIPSKGRTAYSSAKFALHGFFDSLRIEVEERNIFITLIAPGKVQTNFGVNKLDSKGTPFGSKSKKPVGLSSKKAAQIILRAIKKKKRQAIIAKWNDIVWLGLFLRKHFPWLYFELAKRIKA